MMNCHVIKAFTKCLLYANLELDMKYNELEKLISLERR